MYYEYKVRNRWCVENGYKNYNDYLRSPLWYNIRKQVLNKYKSCIYCGSKHHLQVHHKSYTPDVLSGKNISGLVVLCKGCHKNLEIHNGKKRPLNEVNFRINKRTHRQNKQKWLYPNNKETKCYYCNYAARKTLNKHPCCQPCYMKYSKNAKNT